MLFTRLIISCLGKTNSVPRESTREDLLGEDEELAAINLLESKVGHQVGALVHLIGFWDEKPVSEMC